MRNQGDLRSGTRGSRSAGDERVLISISSGQSPGARQGSIQSHFVPVGALAAGLQDPRRIVWIRRSGVQPVQSIHGRRKRERAAQVPFDTEFVVVELLRFDLLSDRRER